MGIDKSFRLLCVPGAATSRTVHNCNRWPAETVGRLTINGMNVQTPRIRGSSAPVLDVTNVINDGNNVISYFVPNQPGQAPQTRSFVMLLCVKRSLSIEANAE